MAAHRIYSMNFGGLYPAYVNKVERKGRTVQELEQVIEWLTGYDARSLEAVRHDGTDVEGFFAKAPSLNPARSMIKGKICGVQIEEIEEDTMREIRYLDKLVDELAKGRAMEKILRA